MFFQTEKLNYNWLAAMLNLNNWLAAGCIHNTQLNAACHNNDLI